MRKSVIYFSYILFLSLLFLGNHLFGQTKEVSGIVLVEGSQNPVPFAHIYIRGTQTGTTSKSDGTFAIKMQNIKPTDSLTISSLGYFPLTVAIPSDGQITAELVPKLHIMETVTIRPGENPAIAFMEKVIARKDQNNPEKLENFSSNEYSKIRFDLNHFTDKIKRNILVRPFDYIWDNTDTTDDGVAFLPILLIEKYSEHYYRKNPSKRKSIVQAKKVTGLPGRKILEFAEDLYFTPNMYDDFVVILEKNFPSPLNRNFNNHYKYVLDSTGVGNDKKYHLLFQPKFDRSLAFIGEMYIHPETYALLSITVRFDIEANVNFVRSYLVEQKYAEVESDNWMLSESNVIGDFTVIENMSDLTGFFGRKRSMFSNYKINNATYEDRYDGNSLVEQLDGATTKSENYWEEHRSENLNEQEEQIKAMFERIENDPKFIVRRNIVQGITTGFVPFKGLEIGDFYTFYSRNYIENSRLKFAFRTNPDSSYRISGGAFGAYGFLDEQWKYGVNGQLRLDTEGKTRLGAEYKYDITQLSRSENILEIDNILTSIFQIGDVTSRVYQEYYQTYLEREISKGFLLRFGYFNNELSAADTVQFREIVNGGVAVDDSYTAAGIDVVLKFNWQNDQVNGDFYSKADLRKRFRRFPDVAFNYQYADPALGSELRYHKISASIRQYVRLRKWGYSLYHIEAGATEGVVPYTFLNTPFSNQLILHDDVAFNLMKYLEFLADRYFTVNLQHHFDGLILDRIPLINKLKWRSFIFGKGYWGSLSDQNLNSDYVLPETSTPIGEPYFEVGFGFENIFKIARMDFIWRVNDPTLPNTNTFIVKPSFVFSF